MLKKLKDIFMDDLIEVRSEPMLRSVPLSREVSGSLPYDEILIDVAKGWVDFRFRGQTFYRMEIGERCDTLQLTKLEGRLTFNAVTP